MGLNSNFKFSQDARISVISAARSEFHNSLLFLFSTGVLMNNENGTGFQEIFIPHSTNLAWKSILRNVSLFRDPTDHIEDLRQIVAEILDDGVRKSLEDFDGSGRVCLIRGCPIDDLLPPTPYSGYLSPKFTPISCLAQLSIFSALGIHPVVYEGENDGRLFRQVVPAKSAAREKSSHGSKFEFGYHVDNPDLPLMSEDVGVVSTCPEYLSLYGLRCDLKVSTRLAILDNVLSVCDSGLLDVLQKNIFKVKRPDSFGASRFTEGLPIISCTPCGREYYSRFDHENIFPMNNEAGKALDEFKDAIKRSGFLSVQLLPGDLLIFKNQQTMHARDSFLPRMDQTDRWLMRLFGVKSLDRVKLMENTRYRVAA